MAEEEKTNLRLEIAHVLFMDIVGYSKLLVDEQREALDELNNLVLNTETVREAEAGGNLIRLPTGDGMALVFTSSMEAPVECALQLSQALRAQPRLPLRMGVHSGPVQHVTDVNGRESIAGAGINIAQRVMDCGDAGHILISKRVADDLAGSRRWRPYLHALGDCEVKHGAVVSLVNFYAEVIGNPVLPTKFGGTNPSPDQAVPARIARPASARWWLPGAGAFVLVVALAFALWQRSAAVRRAAPAVSSSPSTSPTPVAGLASTASEKSIAVLPFANFSEDKDSGIFAEGVQDEVLLDLAKIADLKVISRTSVMQYKDVSNRNLREIAQALGVSHVVEGSVQRAGDKIRVTAQLIDARTDAHQWAEHYDRPLADVFAIQSEIARAIAGQLQAAISPQERAAMTEVPTHDEQAYQLYLRALAYWNNYDNAANWRFFYKNTVDLFREATQRDPGFARAFVHMTEVQSLLYFNYEQTPANGELARGFAETVARLRPGSADARAAMGYYLYYVLRDYPRARDEFAEVVRQSPNDARAYSCLGLIGRRQGRWDEALASLQRSSEFDPANNTNFYNLADLLSGLGRCAELATILDRRIATYPQQSWLHAIKAVLLLNWKADTRAARFELALVPAAIDPAGYVTQIQVSCDEFERDFAAAQRRLAACPLPVIGLGGQPRAFLEGLNARFRGDAAAAEVAFGQVRSQLETKGIDPSGNPSRLKNLAMAEAALGHKEAALEAGRRVVAAVTPGDTVDGPQTMIFWAQTLILAGERDEAIRSLQSVGSQPYGPTYGDLRLNPLWDPLRDDPRFDSLVASLAPKP